MHLRRLKLILSLAFILVLTTGFSQNKLKYRFATTSGIFLKERNSFENRTPEIEGIEVPGGKDKFKPKMQLGFEMEVSIPANESFAFGLEFESYSLKGINDNPVYYNYFGSTDFQRLFKPEEYVYNQEALQFNTKVNSLVGNIRYFPLGIEIFQPFIKVFGGVSFVGTNLELQDGSSEAIPLYSKGTQQSNQTKWPAFYFGTGLGFQYYVTEYLSIYVDATISIIDTDIVNGVPNFSYDGFDNNEHVHTASVTSQFSFGISYSLFKPYDDSDDGLPKKLFRKRRGRVDKYFPFHEIKR